MGIAVFLYVAGAVMLLPGYRWNANPDGLSYLALARRIVDGDLAGSVSGHWGPLLSWLMTPLLALGVEPLLAAWITSLLAGLAALGASGRLLAGIGLPALWHTPALVALVPFLLYAALTVLTPDLLLTCLLTLHLAGSLRPDWPGGAGGAVRAGLIGGLAYLAKVMGLFLFAGHAAAAIGLGLAAAADRGTRRRLWRDATIMAATLSIPVVLWSGVLAGRYGTPMLGSASRYVRTFLLIGHPMHTDGLLPPSDARAHSAWEDPTRLLAGVPSTWPGPWKELAQRIAGHLAETIRILQRITPLACAILAGALVACAVSPRRWAEHRATLLTLLLVLGVAMAYVPVLVDERYLWVGVPALLALGLSLATRAASATSLTAVQRAAAMALVCAALLPMPLRGLARTWGGGQEARRVAEGLRALGVSGPLASDAGWHESMLVAWHLGSPYYGEATGHRDRTTLPSALAEHGVRFYLVWRDGPEEAFLTTLPEVTRGEIPGLRVFRLPEPAG